ncbi:DUF309 domain-containing protein [Nocardia sp. XZ_19_385]|uniref:DUF309 domain-containing protein n=1 Tax=Nocardia sp. XZ_19_385 TaxID=2769488 RepID=UPI00188DDFC0|nr:DUF309 domain-containing protein [Nocardia sp. XZ_19_385]
MVERPRDEAGRARNPRPRDRFGRPLPLGSAGVPRIPDDLDLPPQQTLILAQQLLDDGLAFNAHEVLEAAWKNGPFAERMLWQALAQYAVGITHIQRENPKGARTLLERAVTRLLSYAPVDSGESNIGPNNDNCEDNQGDYQNAKAPYGIDREGLIVHARTLLAALDAGTPIGPEDLKPRLAK